MYNLKKKSSFTVLMIIGSIICLLSNTSFADSRFNLRPYSVFDKAISSVQGENSELDKIYEAIYRSFDGLVPKDGAILDRAKQAVVSNGFEKNSDGTFKLDSKGGLIPLEDDVYLAMIMPDAFSQRTAAKLNQLRDEIISVLPKDVIIYKIEDVSYHIAVAVFQDMVPGVRESIELTQKERERLFEIFADIAGAKESFYIRLEGLRIGADGGVIAVWKDNAVIAAIRQEFYDRVAKEFKDVDEGRLKLILGTIKAKALIHTTLMRIMSDIDENTLNALKEKVRMYKDLRGEDITVEIGAIAINHETQWLLPEKHERLIEVDLRYPDVPRNDRISDDIRALAIQQRQVGFIKIDSLTGIVHRNIGPFEIVFNPGRDRSKMAATIKVKEGACRLCPENMPDIEKGHRWNEDYTIYMNPFPISEEETFDHFVLASNIHVAQPIGAIAYEDINTGVEVIADNSKVRLYFNSLGASIRGHKHFQGFMKPMPIEEAAVDSDRVILLEDNGVSLSDLEAWPATAFLVESKDRSKVVDMAYEVISLMNGRSIPIDLYFSQNKDGILQVYIFPRSKLQAEEAGYYSFLGVPEMCGFLSIQYETDFAKLVSENIGQDKAIEEIKSILKEATLKRSDLQFIYDFVDDRKQEFNRNKESMKAI